MKSPFVCLQLKDSKDLLRLIFQSHTRHGGRWSMIRSPVWVLKHTERESREGLYRDMILGKGENWCPHICMVLVYYSCGTYNIWKEFVSSCCRFKDLFKDTADQNLNRVCRGNKDWTDELIVLHCYIQGYLLLSPRNGRLHSWININVYISC